MMYSLPKSVEVCGATYDIRSDYRAVLDICTALADPELDDGDKATAALDIFYPAFADMPGAHYEDAIKQCFWFIGGGEEDRQNKKAPRLVDWEQDFKYIVSPVNRVIGQEIRAVDYLHWWTFLSAYYEIGDCTFAQIVRIRDRKARGKPLDKQDKEWYYKNRGMVDLKTPYTPKEDQTVNRWLGGYSDK